MDFKELLTILSFFVGVFRATPEGRARRAAIALHKEKERNERKLQKRIDNWRKDRYKFIEELNKDLNKKQITKTQLDEKLRIWDFHHPEPK